MPKRKDIKKILVVGAGPIIIGQACEFDYSGTQACKALKDEGYKVILINSNPATIMTDPDVADKTYVEPITLDVLEKILKKERPDAILPTMGGQTALNLAMEAEKKGILKKYKIENQILSVLKEHEIKMICLAGFMKILSRNFITKFKGKILNIHPSLLPKYKGLNTHQRALDNNEKYSGCTVHFVNSKLDSGKIILQKKVKISKNDTKNSLTRKVLIQEHKLYPRSILKIFSL